MNNPTPKITIVSNGDDWEGLYLDGLLFEQGHSITACQLAEALGLEWGRIEVSPRWLGEKVLSLPEGLDKIPKKAIL